MYIRLKVLQIEGMSKAERKDRRMSRGSVIWMRLKRLKAAGFNQTVAGETGKKWVIKKERKKFLNLAYDCMCQIYCHSLTAFIFLLQ